MAGTNGRRQGDTGFGIEAGRAIEGEYGTSIALGQSVGAGERVALNDVGLFSDGTAVKLVGEETLRLTSLLVDDIVTVNTSAVDDLIAAGRIPVRSSGPGCPTRRTPARARTGPCS